MLVSIPRLSITAAVSASLAASLYVAPSSPCSKFCGNVLSSTAADEIPCDAGTLTGTSTGLVWEQCIDCLLTSNHVSGDKTDLQALLYNLRFNVEQCFFGGETNPCITRTACEPLRDAVEYQNMTTVVGAYDYCSNWELDMMSHCGPCLQGLDGGIHINNYMTILQAACEQKPAPGSTVSIDGDPFGTTPIVVVPPQVSYSSVPTPDYGPISLGARVGIAFGGLAFLLAIAGFCIVCNGKRRRRAYLRELERRQGGQVYPHPKTRYGGSGSVGPDMFETPVSQRPLRGWDNESPVSAHTDGTFPRYFSPYSSQFNSPVTGPEGPGPSNAQWPTLAPQQSQQPLDQLIQTQSPTHGSPPPAFAQWPTVGQEKMLMQMHAHHEKRQKELAIGIALGGDEASLRSKASNPNLNPNGYPVESKGKERDEAYEMHEVESPYSNGTGDAAGRQYEYPYRMPAEPQAPVLHHPGYGRHHGGRPGSGGVSGTVVMNAGASLGLDTGEYGQGQRGFAVS
ncbi:hypothetical protein N657DRAFT_565381 [Parathielavia appendiculata]|uniref:Lpxtg-domain-containing protein n=1 Tax=Parathielavia appendiculata TaxID=2587402 RepID=A0AAN6U876_9PEZI|nr:hypothetical protein N657DRAFT_565381 [Parathielavia appendiculata]